MRPQFLKNHSFSSTLFASTLFCNHPPRCCVQFNLVNSMQSSALDCIECIGLRNPLWHAGLRALMLGKCRNKPAPQSPATPPMPTPPLMPTPPTMPTTPSPISMSPSMPFLPKTSSQVMMVTPHHSYPLQLDSHLKKQDCQN